MTRVDQDPVCSAVELSGVETGRSATEPPPGNSERSHPGKAYRILIVDDEPSMRQFFQVVLERAGYLCEHVCDGRAALEAVRKETYDLVLLDIEMPGMRGTEVLKHLRDLPCCSTLKIILTSGAVPPDELACFLAVGADDYLTKPASVVQLQARVANALKLKEAQDRSHLLNHLLEIRVRERTADFQETNLSLGREIGERKHAEEQLRLAHAETNRLLSSISSILISVDAQVCITRWNPAAERFFGIAAAEALGKPFQDCPIRWRRGDAWERILAGATSDSLLKLDDLWFQTEGGEDRLFCSTIYPVRGEDQVLSGALLLGSDGTDRQRLEEELHRAQKLESIGQLAAGIAHEINTPVQYIGDNTNFLRDAFGDLTRALTALLRLQGACAGNAVTAELLQETDQVVAAADVVYLAEEIPRAIQQTLEGVSHVAKIVRAMKEFSHPGGEEKTSVDINHTIDTTITVARNEWKYVAEVVTDFDASLPSVPCFPGELNQVFLNLLVNAAHAIEECGRGGADRMGTITVSTRRLPEHAEIRVGDTGSGIPEAIRARIFDPFFTTKPVGKGTGQGLSIAHAVVVQKHGGSITFETEVGRGTTFIILLPFASLAPKGGST